MGVCAGHGSPIELQGFLKHMSYIKFGTNGQKTEKKGHHLSGMTHKAGDGINDKNTNTKEGIAYMKTVGMVGSSRPTSFACCLYCEYFRLGSENSRFGTFWVVLH
jgi:hypothetical protein